MHSICFTEYQLNLASRALRLVKILLLCLSQGQAMFICIYIYMHSFQPISKPKYCLNYQLLGRFIHLRSCSHPVIRSISRDPITGGQLTQTFAPGSLNASPARTCDWIICIISAGGSGLHILLHQPSVAFVFRQICPNFMYPAVVTLRLTLGY